MSMMKRICMVCNRRQETQEVEEIVMCECGGASIDEYKSYYHRQQLNMHDRFGEKELSTKPNSKVLLRIELENHGGVPKVFLRGNEISKKEIVKFAWSTRNSTEASVTELVVKHFDNDGVRNTLQIRKEGEMDHGSYL